MLSEGRFDIVAEGKKDPGQEGTETAYLPPLPPSRTQRKGRTMTATGVCGCSKHWAVPSRKGPRATAEKKIPRKKGGNSKAKHET